MTESRGWNWSMVQGDSAESWRIPAVESFWLAERWKAEGKRDILDLGCGLGRHSILFARYGFSVRGMDISAEAVARTKAWAEDEELDIRLDVGDMLSLPYGDSEIDCVYSRNVMNHTDTAGLIQAVGEISRVLRPGGEVYLTLASKSNDGYTGGRRRVDENTFLCDAEGPEYDVPHVYVDHGIVRSLFSAFEIVIEQHIEEYHDDHIRDDGTIPSYFHYHILAKKPE
ncbi:MAG: class I SAM-dependent methyltransferase [Clostridiales bacterium]|nr:class I SAM-dependent methyltransferase [Clostridiales bacterium]